VIPCDGSRGYYLIKKGACVKTEYNLLRQEGVSCPLYTKYREDLDRCVKPECASDYGEEYVLKEYGACEVCPPYTFKSFETDECVYKPFSCPLNEYPGVDGYCKQCGQKTNFLDENGQLMCITEDRRNS